MIENKKKVLEDQIKLIKELKEGEELHPNLVKDIAFLEKELSNLNKLLEGDKNESATVN